MCAAPAEAEAEAARWIDCITRLTKKAYVGRGKIVFVFPLRRSHEGQDLCILTAFYPSVR